MFTKDDLDTLLHCLNECDVNGLLDLSDNEVQKLQEKLIQAIGKAK